ncbi:MAG: amidohydrolase [Rhodothermales bacterium]|nr:amidohydrolase [Rhodothermales bacterium]MBO6778734.1 amidohydrolase [Rhodothermales bacterium]
MPRSLCLVLTCAVALPIAAQTFDVDAAADAIESSVIEWRRDFHQNPELGNREFRTAGVIAAHLERLGIEVQTGVAHTGVVGVLRGGGDGPVVGLRADMDGLPVVERVDLPFKSEVTTTYRGQEVGVMHACGHDTHMAILMGVAEILAENREELQGTVKFLFQPAEEGPPEGEEGGAELMVKEGALKNPDVDVVFGLHIWAARDIGTIGYRPRGIMAGVQDFRMEVHGVQAHGSAPWLGIDPIVTAAQIVNGLQTIVSRSLELTADAAVVTVGSIHGGVRSNIIPENLEMTGTIRTFSDEHRDLVHRRIREVAGGVADAMGARVDVQIPHTTSYPVTYNDPELTARMVPTLIRTAGEDHVELVDAVTGAEDFSFFAREVPGLYFFLGGKSLDQAAEDTPSHHTPDFHIDEAGMKLGVRTMVNLTLDYLSGQ